MKSLCLGVLLLLTACGGSLSDEQRKKFKEGMEQQKIVKVSEAEIMETALNKGQQVYNSLKETRFALSKIDSLEDLHQVKIRWVTPGASNALQLEKELIDAYILGITQGAAQENLQKIWTNTEKTDYDSLLYSIPAITTLEDGTDQLDGLWNIYQSKKDVVLEISKNK